MINRDRVGNSARFLNNCFLTLLDEYFIDDSYHLSGVGMIERAATVARVSRGVELKNIVRRGEPANDFLFQKLCGELRNDYRSDRGNDSSVRDGI